MAVILPAYLAMLWLNEPRHWALGTQLLHILWPSTIPVPWSSGHPKGHSIYSPFAVKHSAPLSQELGLPPPLLSRFHSLS